MKPNTLAFSMDDVGEWTAMSAIGHDGVNFIWRIVVMEDGTFDVNQTDSELKASRRPVKAFARLDLAKKYCQDAENEICADSAYWNSIDEAHLL
jgi:hypothetical protein